MITIISPAKNMKVNTESGLEVQKPRFLDHTKIIMEQLKQYQPWELETLMKINEKLAVQTFLDTQNFELSKKGTPALFAYDGLVFKNIAADQFSKEEVAYANDHLRILSACYGSVRPLDEILPYRLEMQCKMKVEGKSLYQFWDDTLYESLYMEDKQILNLASEEYAKTIRKYAKKDSFTDVEFLTYHKGKLKTLATWAKMARGQMVSFIIKNKIDSPKDVKAFDWNGYEFEESLSTESKYVFVQR